VSLREKNEKMKRKKKKKNEGKKSMRGYFFWGEGFEQVFLNRICCETEI